MNFHDFCPENTSKNMGPGEVPGHVFWALPLKVVLWIHFGIPLRSLWLPLGSLWYPFDPFWLPLGSLWYPFDSFGLPFDSLLSSLRLPFCVFFLTFSSLRSVSSSLYAFLLTFNSLCFILSSLYAFLLQFNYFPTVLGLGEDLVHAFWIPFLFAYVPPWLPFWLRWLPFAPRGYLCGSFKVLLWWVLALFWVTRAAHSVFGWRDLSYIVFFGVLLPP